ncbi:hypothetical protein [Georgenia muralis]
MLHKDVLMQDIDVAQWRNTQELILDSAKERRRIVVLHDSGTVRKTAHSDGSPVNNPPTRVDDPAATARRLYEANRDTVDFVAVFERAAFDAYFARMQDSWDIDEELDGFVQRTYALLDEFPDGMVTHPRPARETLGLQWRLGCSRDDIIAAAERFVEPKSTIVLGVFDDAELWASLVLTFDEARSVTSVTTVDPTEVTVTGERAAVSEAVVDWVRTKHGSCSLALFMDRPAAEAFLQSTDKGRTLREALAAGHLVLDPVPPALVQALA